MTRVVVTGPECTGKTTLARGLAEHYAAACSSEYARTYLDEVGRTLTYDDVEPIARGQLTAEDEAAARAGALLVLDTDLVSTCVYSSHYYGDCPVWIAALARARLADLYLLHAPDVPWEGDGLQREQPERREELFDRFRATLQAWGARVVEIRGGWTARHAAARAAVDALLEETERVRPG
jgi:NadR type nicotinamide-nucleotide adenylyltransferase